MQPCDGQWEFLKQLLNDEPLGAQVVLKDTAHLYGGGACDRVLGQWMEARGNRDEVVIIGKSAHHNADRKRVTPFDITADLFDSLARLRSGYMDIHLLHRDDPEAPVGPIVEILNEHLSAGE